MRPCRRSTLAATVAALAIVAGACSSPSEPGKVMAEVGIDLRLASALTPFDACGDLLDHVRTEAIAHRAEGGVVSPMWGRSDVLAFEGLAGGMAPRPAAATAGEAGDDAAKASAPQASGTNIQEAGVDEPDIVKTDGRRIFTVANGRLQALVVEDGRHRLAGSLLLPGNGGDHELLLAGDRLLVRSSTWVAEAAKVAPGFAEGGVALDMIAPGRNRTLLTLVDVSDPAAPTVVSTYEVDGHVLGARLVGDVARVVTSASPRGFAPNYPTDGSPAEQTRVETANRLQVEESTLRNWLPEYTLASAAPDGSSTSGLAVDCASVSRPAEFSGLGTISVFTFDLSEGLSDGDAVTVLADGQTVYASPEALYVATTRYPDVSPLAAATGVVTPPEETTEIHQFDIRGEAPARHVASGRVRGHLLNQFSMSEHDGHLRVATTDNFSVASAPGASAGASESLVTVLQDRSGVLEKTGEVTGLGRGEQIYAVRFIGPVGYVVTFRQTDPLYTID
ncbi:MAG: beta-propeller domain-containing protein, partial [Acidimicrobiia bacterium]